MNIQHVEGLNDLVEQLTGVTVRERIPDRLIERTDQVVLVDVTPETLLERLREGKIYSTEKVDQSLANFFQRRHLMALRELALPEVADRVEEEIAPVSAARLAGYMDAPLLVVNVQDPNRFLSREQGIQQEASMRLCDDLGAEFLRMESTDVLGTIARIAAERRITQIVMGQTLRSRRQALLRRPLSERLQHRLRGLQVDLHLISDPPAPASKQAG